MDAPEIATARHFLDSIERHDLAAQLSCLTPDAHAYRYRDDKLFISSISEVLESMAKGSGELSAADASQSTSEPVDQVGSIAFERIATVWTHYRFIVQGKVHHHGHKIFSLVNTEDGWKIANVVDEATMASE